jgi:LmbE family N-acetylglucosaminyl deacetylase
MAAMQPTANKGAQAVPGLRGSKPCRLDLQDVPHGLVVALLAPHPDDFDAIGITMRKFHRNGNRIHLAVLSACSGVEDTFCSPPTLENKTAIRQQEQRNSCAFFGLPMEQLEFPALRLDTDGQPADVPENVTWIQGFLERTQADWVFLPHGNDTNSGHRQTWSMFRRAAALSPKPLTGWYNHDPKTIALRVDAVTVFEDEGVAWKGQLLRFHQSQHQRNLLRRGHGLDDRILEVNRRMAKELGFRNQFAEVFELEVFDPSRSADPQPG